MSLFTMLAKDAIDFKRLSAPRIFPEAAGSNSSPCISATLIETTVMAKRSEELLVSSTGLMYNPRRFGCGGISKNHIPMGRFPQEIVLVVELLVMSLCTIGGSRSFMIIYDNTCKQSWSTEFERGQHSKELLL